MITSSLELPTLENMHDIDYQVLRYLVDEMLDKPACIVTYDPRDTYPYEIRLHGMLIRNTLSFDCNTAIDNLVYCKKMAEDILERGSLS